MPESIWFSPLCDQVLAIVTYWKQNYTRGEVHSTCKWNDPVTMLVVDKPTRYAHRLAFTKAEFAHLVRIMETLCQDKALVEELRIIRDRTLPRGQLLFGGRNRVTIAFYPEHVDLIHKTLTEAKNGKLKSIQDYGEPGKGIFE
jgi:hypothetical protein